MRLGQSHARLGCEFAGLVSEEDGFDEFADDGLFVGVELVDGFEVVFEVVGGLAFVGVEREVVGGG